MNTPKISLSGYCMNNKVKPAKKSGNDNFIKSVIAPFDLLTLFGDLNIY